METIRKEIKIRVSAVVYKEIKKQSEELGLSMSAYITHLVLMAKKKQDK